MIKGPLNILIVDDHAIVRTGIKLLLKELVSDFEYYTASNKSEAQKIIKEVEHLDLIFLDINIPDYNCERMIEVCKIKHPRAKILILSMNPEDVIAKRYYRLGIEAYIHKGADDDEIKRAINEVLNDKKYFSINYLNHLANNMVLGDDHFDNPFEKLSQREFEVFKLMIEGKNIQEIANTLFVHSSTISTYKSRIFEKLNTDNLIELYNLYNFHFNKAE